MISAPCVAINTRGICDIKNVHLYSSFFSFNAIHLKFCNNVELTIPKKNVCFVLFFRFWHFGGGNDVTKFPQNFVFSSIGYVMMVSERTHQKDVESVNFFEICLSTQKM